MTKAKEQLRPHKFAMDLKEGDVLETGKVVRSVNNRVVWTDIEFEDGEKMTVAYCQLFYMKEDTK